MHHIVYNRCSKTTYHNLTVAISVLRVWCKIIKQVLGWKFNIWDVYVSQPRGHQEHVSFKDRLFWMPFRWNQHTFSYIAFKGWAMRLASLQQYLYTCVYAAICRCVLNDIPRVQSLTREQTSGKLTARVQSPSHSAPPSRSSVSLWFV